jgi:acetylornithine/succinyldiaminopimelate/putrescine aminotransferase
MPQIVAALVDQVQKMALTSRAFYNGMVWQLVPELHDMSCT